MDTHVDRNQRESEPRGLERLALLVSRARPLGVAVGSGVAITVLAAAGILQRTTYPLWGAANLDSEASVAMWFSAALLWAAAGCWLLVAVTARPWRLAVWIWWLVLAWLALDEGNAFHERLERWSGIDWQILYLPIMALAVVAWWGVVRRHQNEGSNVALLVGGAVAWAAALVLELVQNWGGPPVKASIYDPAMITEEVLEMIGSTLMLVAAILALRRSTGSERT
jgi:hypothetical protein